jgi:quercetin dioxygenase-like cupin family protein
MPGDIAEQSPIQVTNWIFLSRIKPGAFSDWHNAPRRQYVIPLAGAIEIGLGNGSVHRLGPGDGILAEDLSGKGHTTRAVGNDTRVVVIPLAG